MADILLVITVLICLITDLKWRKIYNIVLIPPLILGILFNLYSKGWEGLVNSLIGFFFGLALLLLPFLWGGIGGGDVKLLATIGAIKGSKFVFYTFLGMGISGGIVALILIIFQGRLIKTLKNIGQGFQVMILSKFKVINFSADAEKVMFPYCIPITIGTLAAYFMG